MIAEMEYLKSKVYYSQNREDLLLEAFFINIDDGFYVDIGGYDPDDDSVTKLFYEKGWSGINVEPQYDRFLKFVETRTRDINLNCGVSNEKSELTLRSYKNGGLSTFSSKMKKDYEKGTNPKVGVYKDVKVPVVTLRDIFQDNNIVRINFMKIDVEGLEYEVLQGNDWDKYRPEVICIESNHILKDWKELILQKEYDFVFFDGLNDYYVDAHSDKKGVFDYVEHIIESRGGGLKYGDYKLYEEKEKHYKHLKMHEKSLEDAVESLGVQLDSQREILDSIRALLSRAVELAVERVIGKKKK